MRNVFTVDVEDWFHVCGIECVPSSAWSELPARVVENTRVTLDLLDRCRTRATFFTLGWIAERYPGLVQTIRQAGHEIASHGHLHRRVFELDPAGFEADLDSSLMALRAAGCGPIEGFRAAEWSINDRSLWALDVLARKGFSFDSSMTPLRLIGNPAYPQMPHTKRTAAGDILEFPPLVCRRWGQNIPLGGGWGLRMTRPRTVLAEIDRRNRLGYPVALFVHPWELDADPPRMALPPARRFAHYYGLAGYRDRLEEILLGAEFAPMGEVLGIRGAAA